MSSGAPQCFRCGKVVDVGDTVVRAMSESWHVNCLRCHHCEKVVELGQAKCVERLKLMFCSRECVAAAQRAGPLPSPSSDDKLQQSSETSKKNDEKQSRKRNGARKSKASEGDTAVRGNDAMSQNDAMPSVSQVRSAPTLGADGNEQRARRSDGEDSAHLAKSQTAPLVHSVSPRKQKLDKLERVVDLRNFDRGELRAQMEAAATDSDRRASSDSSGARSPKRAPNNDDDDDDDGELDDSEERALQLWRDAEQAREDAASARLVVERRLSERREKRSQIYLRKKKAASSVDHVPVSPTEAAQDAADEQSIEKLRAAEEAAQRQIEQAQKAVHAHKVKKIKKKGAGDKKHDKKHADKATRRRVSLESIEKAARKARGKPSPRRRNHGAATARERSPSPPPSPSTTSPLAKAHSTTSIRSSSGVSLTGSDDDEKNDVDQDKAHKAPARGKSIAEMVAGMKAGESDTKQMRREDLAAVLKARRLDLKNGEETIEFFSSHKR